MTELSKPKIAADSTCGQAFPAVKSNFDMSLYAFDTPHINGQIEFPGSHLSHATDTSTLKMENPKLMTYQSLLRQYCPTQADRFFGLMVLLNKEGENENFLDEQKAILLLV